MGLLGFANVHVCVQCQVTCFRGHRVCQLSDSVALKVSRVRVRHARMAVSTDEKGNEHDKLFTDRNPEKSSKSDDHHNTDDFPLSDEALALFREQLDHPVFNPGLVHGELGSTLSHLQNTESTQFVTSSHLSSTVKGNDSNVGTAVDLLEEGYVRYIEYARETIKQTFPGITEPGGKLYPEMRSKACWRDLESFTRVVGYAVASDGLGFSEQGMDTLAKVYKELDVPLDAVLVGVDAVRRAAVRDAANAQVDVREHAQNKTATASEPHSKLVATGPATLLDQMFKLLLSHLKGFQYRPSQ